MKVALIAAVAQNGVIGNKGGIPWNLPADLKYFAAKTMGRPVIMGYRTFKSIEAVLGGPLKGRTNIVLVNRSATCTGCALVWSVEEALQKASTTGAGEVFVIGGEVVYRQFLPRADFLYLTRVHGEFAGDTFFPEFDPSQWELRYAETHEADLQNSVRYTFEVYRRLLE